jgi:hypothetical protein
MYFWDRKIIAMTAIIMAGLIYLSGVFTSPPLAPDSNVEKLTNYLYTSAPVIVKKIKAFFHFSELPIIEVAGSNAKPAVAHNQPPQNPRAHLLVPSPTASPVAAKPAAKPADKTAEEGDPNRKSKFVVETYNNNKLSDDDFGNKTEEPESPTISGAAPNFTNTNEQKMNDWKYRLFMNPSKDNMNAFVQEYMSGKVSKEVFYSVLKSLISESDDRSQAIAVYGLSATPSFESYEILTLKIDEKSLRKENQALAQKSLDNYASSGNTRVLLIALRSSRDVVRLQALHSVNKLVEGKHMTSQSQNVASLSDREKRGTASNQMKKDSYLEFVDTLQSLTHDPNSQIAILAENTLQQFQEVISPPPSNYEAANYQPNNSQPPSRVR